MTTLRRALEDYAPDHIDILRKDENPNVEKILELPISNYDFLCKYPVKTYLLSMDFIADIETCKDDFIEAVDLGKEPFLFLFRNSDTSIVLRIAYGEPEYTPAQ